MSGDQIDGENPEIKNSAGAENDAHPALPSVDQEETVPQVEASQPFSIWSKIYNHNPFYVISTMCLLYGILSMYRHIPIGQINLWGVMGILCGYTVMYAFISIAVIRFGKVWEDARSILLLILLLFLAISVCTDDIQIALDDAQQGFWLATGGFLFALILSEVVLKCSKFSMRLAYLIPYYLFLALFFYTPYWFAINRDNVEPLIVEWGLLLFPTIAAGIVLTLLPAVWLGPGYIQKNGTPWSWPMYPWSIFFMLIVAVLIRTYALSMTFGPGQLWDIGSSGKLEINFSTIWGPWFYIPLLAAVALLLIEGGFVTGNSSQRQGTLLCALFLIPLSLMIPRSEVSRIFLQELINFCGSPIWITLWILVGLYAWSYVRGERKAGGLCLLVTSGFCYIGRGTFDEKTLVEFQSWPLLVVGICLLIYGIYQQQSWIQYAATCLLGIFGGMQVHDPQIKLFYREYAFIVMWLSAFVIGFVNRDQSAYIVRAFGVILCLLFAVYLIDGNLPWMQIWQKSLILLGLSLVMYAISWIMQSWMYRYNSYIVLSLFMYLSVSYYYRNLSQHVGAETMAAFCWSVGTLLIGLLISGHKGKWFVRNNKEN